MSARPIPIRQSDSRPVTRRELESVTQRSLMLLQMREDLESALRICSEMEADLNSEKRGLLARLANGAELDD